MILMVALLFPGATNANEFWQFGVYLGDKRIGEHRFELKRDDGVERVASVAQFKATLLFVPLYTYEHTAEEEWAEGCLQSIRSSSRANSKRFMVTGAREGGRLIVNAEVNGLRESRVLDGCVRAFAYWDRRRLDDAEALLNPQTGIMERAQLIDEGENRRLITDTADIDVWYSTDDHWLGLEMMTPAGKPLTYRLEDSHRTLAALTATP
jgi:hypothetical protein